MYFLKTQPIILASLIFLSGSSVHAGTYLVQAFINANSLNDYTYTVNLDKSSYFINESIVVSGTIDNGYNTTFSDPGIIFPAHGDLVAINNRDNISKSVIDVTLAPYFGNISPPFGSVSFSSGVNQATSSISFKLTSWGGNAYFNPHVIFATIPYYVALPPSVDIYFSQK